MKNYLLCFLTLLLLPFYAKAQTDTFTCKAFVELILKNHPLAKQIRLLEQKANAELQAAKGSLDPLLSAQWDNKQFSQTNYYQLFNTNVKIPTLWGVEFETGYNLNKGYYLNPEEKTPYSGQAYAGLNIPLLNGFLTNERRTMIAQAGLLKGMNQAQIQTQLNDLLYDAVKVYWEWVFAYNEVKVWERAYKLNQERLRLTRIAFEQGDKPAIDTLESFSNLQDRQLRVQESLLDMQEALFVLSNYLWSDAGEPMQLSDKYIPQAFNPLFVLEEDFLNQLLNNINQNHPDIIGYNLKLQELGLDYKLKKNKLLPKLDLKYNFLAYNTANFFETGAGAFAENYKFGVKFSMPIFLRSARANLDLNKIKTQETNYKLSQKRLEVQNKTRLYAAEIRNYTEQIKLISNNVQNYERLLNAEQEKFGLGESSIFVLNSRELKLIETQQKLFALQSKLEKSKISLAWAVARLEQGLF